MYKLKVLYLFIFLGTIAFLLIGAIGSPKEDYVNSNKGKIKFSHSLHKDVVDCVSCHSEVKESVDLKIHCSQITIIAQPVTKLIMIKNVPLVIMMITLKL